METVCEIAGKEYVIDFTLSIKKDFTLFEGTLFTIPRQHFSYCHWHNYKTSIFSPFDIPEDIKASIINAIQKSKQAEFYTDSQAVLN